MQDVIEKYKEYLILNGASKNTILNYLAKLTDLLKVININNITQNNIDEFFISSKNKYNARTLNFYRSVLSSFLKFLNKEEEFRIPKHYKEIKKEINFIKEDEFENEILKIVDIEFKNSAKVKAILFTMFYTGLRKQDICKLKRENFDIHNQRVKVYISKSKVERTFCLTKKAINAIESYFASEEEITNAFNITYRYIRTIIDRIKPYITNKNIYPHLFRHSFASHCIKAGVGVKTVQELLGHANLSTTELYTHTTFEDIEKEYHEKIG